MSEEKTAQEQPVEVPVAESGPPADVVAPAADVDYGRQLDALRAELTALRGAKESAEQEAEAARIAGLTEAERLDAERAAWKQEVEADRARLRVELRDAALDRAGVLSKYNNFAPDVDVRTPEGQKALESWLKDHPETIKRPDVVAQPTPTDALIKRSSKLAEILTGKRKSTLITQKSIEKMFNSN
tara:strand:+ start:835 stop:1392 length:558 start_codon:yes stop_codon:yes gene_type:complete